MQSHEDIDSRSLALHRLVAAKVRLDASLLDRARETLVRWQGMASPRTHGYLDAWRQLLDQDIEHCLEVATAPTEYGNALRQASPLACLLSSKERFAFLKQWKEGHAPQ